MSQKEKCKQTEEKGAVVVQTVYPRELLERLEQAISVCPETSGNYLRDKREYDILKTALDPVLEIRNNAIDLSNIDMSKSVYKNSDAMIKSVELDMWAEKLIFDCIKKQNELLDW